MIWSYGLPYAFQKLSARATDIKPKLQSCRSQKLFQNDKGISSTQMQWFLINFFTEARFHKEAVCLLFHLTSRVFVL